MASGPDPQSLKSWEDAFQYPIPTVRRVEQELRRDIASNKEKLRALVGTRYRELVGTAETIVSMNREIQDVDSNLADIGQRCNPRLVEKKTAHLGQIKSDVLDKDADKRAVGAQLSLLHRCAATISRLLRRRASPLLIAKLFVISRLLHKTLSQGKSVPPFLETLRGQLASLRQTLLKRIRKCLGSANSTADDTIEALAAYCLTTSSSSDDAIRHFRDVRLGVIDSQLALTDFSGENVLKAFLLYIRTLQTSKILLSRRLSDVLGKLKARPILTDPEVRNLDDLGIDILGRWAAPEVTNFTPWIKLSELSKSDSERVIKQWSSQAFEALVKGCHSTLGKWNDFPDLLALRKKTLDIWLSSRSSTSTHSSLGVLEGIRTTFNEQLTRILSNQAKKLDQFGQNISFTISYWESKEHTEAQSLWDHNIISLDYSNGATAFKQTVMDKLLGRDEDISAALKIYQNWRSTIDSSKQSIHDLRRTKWSDILDEGEDEDPDVDITAMLNDDDPRLLRDEFQSAVRQSLTTLQDSFSDTFCAFGQSNRNLKTAYLLRLVRLVRRDLPTDFVATEFSFSSSIVPKLQEMLATEIIALTTPLRLPDPHKRLPGRSLWEGDPELPLQPSPYTFKFLRRLMESMNQCGQDLWDLSTVQVLKQTLQRELSNFVVTAFENLESPAPEKDTPKPESESETGQEDESRPTENGTEEQRQPEPETTSTTSKEHIRDCKVQIFYDTIYLKGSLATKDLEQSQCQLADAVEKLRASLDSEERVAKNIEKAAGEYWKRTKLLFGLFAVGSE
ncbi:uncharacterized protein ACHE_50152A [Aspergillus chevalieri]|uniref:Conserved oligomeric Golgi complex subunit 1 n=1 Tax=Aspergillus chevalieri TaxID=182096 RepID=A0A7R7ZPT6_ASPCH|nr:uncharacterized protein ACHE_50152A [Aspergillus chevalieri]BCR88954.1 hypothetical protein ACHE_50152A [Aspergillus chevalieri]